VKRELKYYERRIQDIVYGIALALNTSVGHYPINDNTYKVNFNRGKTPINIKIALDPCDEISVQTTYITKKKKKITE
jgi:hypothetical protein